jgi:hypothetical protein
MDFETNKLLAENYMGMVTSEDYVQWAVTCLESDVDSKNIRILASLYKPLYSSEVEYYFSRCLKDLGWTRPEPRECLFNYARDLAQRILSGELSPQDGYSKIYNIALALNYPRELISWVYLDDSMELSIYNDSHGPEWEDAIRDEAARLINDRFQ